MSEVEREVAKAYLLRGKFFADCLLAAAEALRSGADRIARRFDSMLEQGLATELKTLREEYGLESGMPSMRCVGYRQAWDYLEGRIDLEQLREQGIAATRQLAKRQLTWLRSMEGITEFDCLAGNLADLVLNYVRRELEALLAAGRAQG